MSDVSSNKPALRSGVLRSLLLIATALLCVFRPRSYAEAFLSFRPGSIPIIVLSYLFIFVVVAGSLYFLYRLDIPGMISEFGLQRGFLKGLVFGLIATLPMTVSSAVLFRFSGNLFSFRNLILIFVGPVTEEILFRGYLFGELFRRERWGFIPAALIASVLFGGGHLYQAHDFAGAAGTFLVTFMGSAWAAWLYVELDGNLWIPIWLHVMMNLSWTVFQTDTTGAIGSSLTNLFRLLTILITVVYTLRYSRKNGRKINRRNLIVSYAVGAA